MRFSPCGPGSNPVSIRTHLVVSSAYERDFANAVGGECLIIRTSTSSTKKSLQFKKAVDNMARSAVHGIASPRC